MKNNSKMNARLNSFVYLPMAALLITAAVAGLAAAQKGVPFKGVIEGAESFLPPCDGFDINRV